MENKNKSVFRRDILTEIENHLSEYFNKDISFGEVKSVNDIITILSIKDTKAKYEVYNKGKTKTTLPKQIQEPFSNNILLNLFAYNNNYQPIEFLSKLLNSMSTEEATEFFSNIINNEKDRKIIYSALDKEVSDTLTSDYEGRHLLNSILNKVSPEKSERFIQGWLNYIPKDGLSEFNAENIKKQRELPIKKHIIEGYDIYKQNYPNLIKSVDKDQKITQRMNQIDFTKEHKSFEIIKYFLFEIENLKMEKKQYNKNEKDIIENFIENIDKKINDFCNGKNLDCEDIFIKDLEQINKDTIKNLKETKLHAKSLTFFQKMYNEFYKLIYKKSYYSPEQREEQIGSRSTVIKFDQIKEDFNRIKESSTNNENSANKKNNNTPKPK